MSVQLDKRERRYIELEIARYDVYCREIAAERERILTGSTSAADSAPVSGGKVGRPTEVKALALISSPAILRMERVVQAVDRSLARLTRLHRRVFDLYFRAGRRDYYAMCDELGMSVETFRRYRRAIVETVGMELGIVVG